MSTLSSSAPAPGSAPLADASHEAFCRAILGGMPNLAAYRAAGYTNCTDRAASTGASRLMKKADICARLAWLKTQAADKTVMDLNEVLQELTKLGRSDIRHCVVGGDNTADVIASVHELPPEHSACIQELTVETYVEGSGDDARDVKRVKVKLHDKRGALNELRRHFEPNKHEHSGPNGGPIETADVSEAPSELELARRIAFTLEKGARATAAGTIAGQAPTAEKPAAAKPKKKRRAKTPKPAAEAAPAPAEQPKKD